MCGISAIFGAHPEALNRLSAMTGLIRHRGPDDEGLVYFHPEGVDPFGGADTPESVLHSAMPYAPASRSVGELPAGTLAGLGHRRLAVTDGSPAGHQPMSSLDRRYWISYNGEIYNFRELRTELQERGHRFATQTDTEVILAAFAEWGAECLQRFNGMWAFVLVDRQAGRIFAARDRFGIKPLYYWFSPEGFLALASEIKQFTVLPGWRARLNGQRTYDFLVWGMQDHTDETLFHGVRQLQGGEAFEARFEELGLELPVYRWYALNPRPFEGSFQAASDEFRALLRDAVSLRLRTDVPLGACLSGGLDSSTIVCLASEILGESGGTQKTFTAGSEVKRFDEREYVDEVRRACRIDSHITIPTVADLFEALQPLSWHQDEPFGSTSIYAQWRVFKLASEYGVRVLLDGQGADEQLAGYRVYHAPRLASLFRTFQWRTLRQEIAALRTAQGFSTGDALKQLLNATLPEPLLQGLARARGLEGGAPDWLNLSILGAVPLNPSLKHGARNLSIRDLSHTQLTATHLPMLLHWEDRNAMAHAVESRLPFLDYRLVESVLGMPDAFKFSEGISKRVLRNAMIGRLPERIRLRMDKLGFATPEEVWVREQAPERFRLAMREAVAVSEGILDERACRMLDQMIDGRRPFSALPWRLISFGAWLETFKVRGA